MTNRAHQVSPQELLSLSRGSVNLAYRNYLRSLPCCVSGRNWAVEVAHTGPRALGRKASDLDAIPLNREFHQPGYPDSYHTLGRVAFEKRHGINIQRIIKQLQNRAEACGVDLTQVPRKPGQSSAFSKRRRA